MGRSRSSTGTCERSIALVVSPRADAAPTDRLIEEGTGAGQVAALAEEHVDLLAGLVHRPIQVRPPARDPGGGLVGPPASPDRLRVPAPLGREEGAEVVDPREHRARGHINVALRQQVADVRCGQAVAEVPAHGRRDHVERPPMTSEGRARAPGEGPPAGATPEALATRRAAVALHRRV
jgi:hypothetical protein